MGKYIEKNYKEKQKEKETIKRKCNIHRQTDKQRDRQTGEDI